MTGGIGRPPESLRFRHLSFETPRSVHGLLVQRYTFNELLYLALRLAVLDPSRPESRPLWTTEVLVPILNLCSCPNHTVNLV